MNFTRLVIIVISTTIMAFVLHLLVYQMDFTYTSISNSLFVVSILFLLPSFVAITRAFEVFHGINYVFRVIISPSFKREYPHFSDFKAEKTGKTKSTIFLEMMITASTMMIISIILALVATK